MSDVTHDWRLSFETAWPVVMGYFAVSFVFGLAAVNADYPAWFPVAMCMFVYAGASQFAALALLGTAAPLWTIVSTTFLINARHMLMSFYMSKALQNSRLSRTERALYAIGLTDETFAMHSTMLAKKGLLSFVYMVSFNGYCHLAWIVGASMGALAAQFITDVIPFTFDYALTAMMLFVLVALCGSRVKLIVAGLTILTMCILSPFIDATLALFLSTFMTCGAGLCLKTFISPSSSR